MRLIACIGSLFLISLIPKKLDRQHAIRLAEDFIRRNGYTNAPADTSEYRLSYELNDQFSNDIGTLIRRRHNTLYPKAFCIIYDKERWRVGFLSTAVELDKLDSVKRNADLPGRTVTISGANNYIEMDHKSPLFSRFEKL